MKKQFVRVILFFRMRKHNRLCLSVNWKKKKSKVCLLDWVVFTYRSHLDNSTKKYTYSTWKTGIWLFFLRLSPIVLYCPLSFFVSHGDKSVKKRYLPGMEGRDFLAVIINIILRMSLVVLTNKLNCMQYKAHLYVNKLNLHAVYVKLPTLNLYKVAGYEQGKKGWDNSYCFFKYTITAKRG